MSTWNIYLWESGSTYTSDGTIPRPNQNLETSLVSNLQIIKLADGSEAFMYPETKYLKGTLTMFFADTTSVFRTQIEGYITNGDKVKITTHTAEDIIGRFIDYKRVWFTGIDDAYDVMVTFKQLTS